MKQRLLFFFMLAAANLAHAQVDDSAFFGAGLRLGLGYNFVEYEQKISDTGTNFTTGATEISFLHLSYAYQWNSNLLLLIYGSLGTTTYEDSPSSAPGQKHTEMTGDVNAETRFSFGEHQEKESWVPVYILGMNATYMTVVRAPESLTGGYEYGQIPVISPVIGLTTTLWGERSAWRNTVRLGMPLASGSGMEVRSGYSMMALTSYTFALGEHMTLGIEGLMSYLSLKLTEVSPATSLDVDHDITQFVVGPRVFFTIDW